MLVVVVNVKTCRLVQIVVVIARARNTPVLITKCPNCRENNTKLKRNYHTNHTASLKTEVCSSCQAIKGIAVSRIDYVGEIEKMKCCNEYALHTIRARPRNTNTQNA